MEPKLNLLGSLLGNLNISPNINFTKNVNESKSTQINHINININDLAVYDSSLESLRFEDRLQSGSFKSGYHAVYLSNDQVYFGQLELINNKKFVKLKKIIYLKADAIDIEGETANLNLAKLGDEIHGPEDLMHINTSHIVFWEKLRDSSPVVRAIIKYENQRHDD